MCRSVLLGIVAVTKLLPDMPPRPTAPLDLPGVVLSGLAASGIVFGLSVVSLPALPPWVGIVAAVTGVICAIAYLAHARRAKHPVLKLSLLSNQTFRASVTGGSIFRIAIGGVPFVLPLMLQLGFGYTPFQSGLTTFVIALGAIAMKLATARLFRRFGFRRVFIAGSLATAASIARYGPVHACDPGLADDAVIFIGGFIRSMYFTGVNVFAYADIAEEDVSRATPIAAVAQQLSIALGVALAGLVLELRAVPGQGPQLADFHAAFFVMAAVAACAAFAFIRLPPDAGSAMSGHGAPQTSDQTAPELPARPLKSLASRKSSTDSPRDDGGLT
jgi:hypothetical protein